MATYFRSDQVVQDALGNAISGAQIYFCLQPATTGVLPPSPLAQLYADPAGAFPITQPVTTDGYGHAFAYMGSNVYTVVYYSPQIGERVLPDQIVSGVTAPITTNVISGNINGTNRVFTLGSTPTNFSMVFLNGVLQIPGINYTISGPIVTFSIAPESGDQLWSVYQ